MSEQAPDNPRPPKKSPETYKKSRLGFLNETTEECEEVSDKVTRICIEEFNAFCKSGENIIDISSKTNGERAQENYEKLFERIKERILSLDDIPTMFDETSEFTHKTLKEYLGKFGYHLEFKYVIIKGEDDKEYAMQVIGIYRIAKEEKIPFANYFPEYLKKEGEGGFPDIVIKYLDDNLITELRKSAKSIGITDMDAYGTTENQQILLFQGEIEKNGLDLNSVKTEEIGHTIFDYILDQATMGLPKTEREKINELRFGISGETHSILEVNELFASLTQLRYGGNFEETLEGILNDQGIDQYRLLNETFSKLTREIANEMGLINTKGQIEIHKDKEKAFKAELLKRAESFTFSVLASIIKAIEKHKA